MGNNHKTAPLYGLVLAGGKCQRMGKDKGLLNWHGKPQRYFLADMLATSCQQTYISCRPDQVEEILAAGYQPLPDIDVAEGQYRAILSAMAAQPASAWLVVACDLPLFDNQAMALLIKERDASKLATAYKNYEGLPEPLAAIWEPASQTMLLNKLSIDRITCPRKALIRSVSNVKLIKPALAHSITNVNTPSAAKTVKALIKEKLAQHVA